jgi:hypothetical protein
LRRANVRPRRFRAGPDPQPDAPTAGAARTDLSADYP